MYVFDLGQRDYAVTLAIQRRLVSALQEGAGAEHLLLVEHDPPAVTLGRRGEKTDLRVGEAALAGAGVELHRSRRGGAATWHGPGQLVAYPIAHLRRRQRPLTLRDYVHRLEQAVIDALAALGLPADRRDDAPGVWTGGRKIASVGVAVERWTAYHGVAVNVGADLRGFELIVPCASPEAQVTSVSRELGRDVGVEELKPILARRLAAAVAAEGEAKSVPEWTTRRAKPAHLRRAIPSLARAPEVRGVLDELELHTVCGSARCPNIAECFARGTATFLVMGNRCTRRCAFCAVDDPPASPLRADEPGAVASAAARLGLRHVVVTSVTRDDLPDGGAGHFAEIIRAVRRESPDASVEVLIPDFRGDPAALRTVLDTRPDVLNHNMETVARLYPLARPDADYARSLELLRRSAASGLCGHVKSGIMLGLGETGDEVRALLADLRAAGCDCLTLGQYLRPGPTQLPVQRYLRPEEFDAWAPEAEAMGFADVASGVFVRSSYRAERVMTDHG